jgi:hypothetical protein
MTAAPTKSTPAGAIGVALLLVCCVLGVARVQPRLATTLSSIKAREDVYVFPPPAELKVATLGYLAAAADLLWAGVSPKGILVEYGVHWSERRPFPDLNRYLDAILELDPKFKPLYEMVDTMLVYRPIHGSEDDARAARVYLEKGIATFPYDPDIWLHYGQFIAFMGPTFLPTDAEKDRWREEGAYALEHAAELGADVDKALVASSMLNRRFGERDAAIRSLRRVYALADDDATRAEISARLEVLQASAEDDRAQGVVQAIDNAWRRDMPFVPRDEYLLLGPLRSPASCAGHGSEGRRDCATSWDDVVSGL